MCNVISGSYYTSYLNTWGDSSKDDVYNLYRTTDSLSFSTEHLSSFEDVAPGGNGNTRPLREQNTGRKSDMLSVQINENLRSKQPKLPQAVAKRNARERRRVQAVNGAFVRLRTAVPFECNRGKRISKVKTLKNAIKYIQSLQQLLEKSNEYYEYSNLYY